MGLFPVMCKSGKCENVVVAPTKRAAAELIHPIPPWSKRK